MMTILFFKIVYTVHVNEIRSILIINTRIKSINM